MTKLNDNRILELKKQIEKKKEEMGGSSKFNPATNCILVLDDKTHNLNTLNKESAILLLAKLSSLVTGLATLDKAYVLNYCDDFSIGGYHINDWIEDVQSKLGTIKFKEEQTKLKQMEDALSKLLSEEKSIELKINEIENLLK